MHDQSFEPSKDMVGLFDRMWCSGFEPASPEWKAAHAEVRRKVHKAQMCKASLVGLKCPELTSGLSSFIEISQAFIDDAWYDAAIRALGRPAYREDFLEEPAFSEEGFALALDGTTDVYGWIGENFGNFIRWDGDDVEDIEEVIGLRSIPRHMPLFDAGDESVSWRSVERLGNFGDED